jgi:2-methylisocitrate lyase-like PEP mutase family enzyme
MFFNIYIYIHTYIYLYARQVSPKRCGHVSGKSVVSRQEAALRISAAVKARDEGDDIVILARTDGKLTDLSALMADTDS